MSTHLRRCRAEFSEVQRLEHEGAVVIFCKTGGSLGILERHIRLTISYQTKQDPRELLHRVIVNR